MTIKKARDILSYLDLMLLDPEMTLKGTLEKSQLAVESQIGSIFVKPCYLHQAAERLRDEQIQIGTVLGYPHGSNTTYIKLAEAKRALMEGAQVLELVINLGDAKGQLFNSIRNEIQTICGLAHMNHGEMRIVVETGLLTQKHLMKIIEVAAAVKVDGFVTSTGFDPQTNQQNIVQAISEHFGKDKVIKAVGRINNIKDINDCLNAGYNRIGIPNL